MARHLTDDDIQSRVELMVQMRRLSANLAVGGALCAAYEVGADPPKCGMGSRRTDVGSSWWPGCQWPVPEGWSRDHG